MNGTLRMRRRALRRLADHLSAQTPARFTLRAVHDQTSWAFSSDTRGLALDLPAPFDKPASQAWPLHIEDAPLSTAGGGGTSRLVSVPVLRTQSRIIESRA